MDAGAETNIDLNHEVYYHFLGTDQSVDILCWRDPEHPKYINGIEVTDDGKVTSSLVDVVWVDMMIVEHIVMCLFICNK